MPSRDTFSSDFQDFGIPDALRGASTVHRTTRIDYIGDTHGNYEGFLFNMRALGLIDEQGDWIGKNRRLVVIGDIYADRHFGSLQTGHHIEKLRKQGAQIDQLAGNHEEALFGYFDDVHDPDISIFDTIVDLVKGGRDSDITEFSGLQEMLHFRKKLPDKLDWQTLIRTRPKTILERMRLLKRGKVIISNLCGLQIGKIIDDTLFLHTDPVDGMIIMFEKYDWDIEKINAVFRAFLVQTLLEGKYDTDLLQEALIIRQCFLDSDNRRMDDSEKKELFSNGSATILKTKLRIRRIVHGHTDHFPEQTIFRGGLEITSTDNSSYKGGDEDPWNTYISAGSILRNGHRIAPRE